MRLTACRGGVDRRPLGSRPHAGGSAAFVLSQVGIAVTVAAIAGAALCFVIRMVGVQFGLNAPYPPAPPAPGPDDDE